MTFSETSGNVEAAIEWIFNNPDESLMPIEAAKPETSSSDSVPSGSDSPNYELVAFIRIVSELESQKLHPFSHSKTEKVIWEHPLHVVIMLPM